MTLIQEHNATYHDELRGSIWLDKVSKYACTFCGKLLKTKTGMSRHLSLYHKDLINVEQPQEIKVR